MTPTLRPTFEIEIDPDALRVSLTLAPRADCDKISKQDIMAALEEREVVSDSRDEERIGRLIRGLRRGDVPQDPVVIVQGTPPVHGLDGRIVNVVASPKVSDDGKGRVDHYELNRLQIVNTGETVLEITPPTRHKHGKDVFGREAPARPGRKPTLVLGANVAVSEDWRSVYATAGGRFRFEQGVASVEPLAKHLTVVHFRSKSTICAPGLASRAAAIRAPTASLAAFTGSRSKWE